ncbi:MAG TPA: FISUMP domain-containing protein [Bacteroidales bacterium]|nr:MAG: hypothetical protein BWX77_00757 [Bacteroidetes bacterium ADurb.Bin090]HQN88423.1 FISUMP domain-containing protein [Bacteroidales bacterium]
MKTQTQTRVGIIATMLTLSLMFFLTNCTVDGEGDDIEGSLTSYPYQYGSMKDVDGNTYLTVTIGDRLWMAENLRTTQYYNDYTLENNSDNHKWVVTKNHGQYCWYTNDEATYKSSYGALYNWAAVESARLCPMGWHVPSKEEWLEMIEYLAENGYNYDGTTGGNGDKIALAMSSDLGCDNGLEWNVSTKIGAVGDFHFPMYDNKSGFRGHPSGCRSMIDGEFYGKREFTGWWTCTSVDDTLSYYVRIDVDSPKVCLSPEGHKNMGYSVRCIKNKFD